MWAHYSFWTAHMEQVEANTRPAMKPHQEPIALLDGVPGRNEVAAWTVMAELGVAAQVCSWAGLCPGSNESAGQQISSSTRKGNRYLRRGL